jgi:16S rRNA G1207 methylase RsmC
MADQPKLPPGQLADFLSGYARSVSRAELAVEREVFGTNAGITSYTTPDQAGRLAEVLQLRAGLRVLDVGAGAGWPGLFIAGKSGCEVVLTDVPVAALRHAVASAHRRGVAQSCGFAAASGTHLPFRSRTFDAVVHADVLC